MEKTGFFEVSPGNRSLNRLIVFIFCVYAVLISSFVFYTAGYAEGIATFTAVAGLSVTAKVIQKSQENEKTKTDTLTKNE